MFDGTRKQTEKLLNFSAPELRCYQDKLRAQRVTAAAMSEVVNPEGGGWGNQVGGGPAFNAERVIQEQRIMLGEGFKDEKGEWEMQAEDIVLISDQDEIPTVSKRERFTTTFSLCFFN